jgi:hypothetical protein
MDPLSKAIHDIVELKELLRRGKTLMMQSTQETESLMDKACDWMSDVDDALGTNDGN